MWLPKALLPDSCLWMDNGIGANDSQNGRIARIAAPHSLKSGGRNDINILLWLDKAWQTLSNGFLEYGCPPMPPFKGRYECEAAQGEMVYRKKGEIAKIAKSHSLKYGSHNNNSMFLWLENAWQTLCNGFLEDGCPPKLPLQGAYECEAAQGYNLGCRSFIHSTEMLYGAAVVTMCNLSELNIFPLPWIPFRGFLLQVGTFSSSRMAQNLKVDMKMIESHNLSTGGFACVQKHPPDINAALSVWDLNGSSADGSLEAPDSGGLRYLQKHSPAIKADASKHPPGIRAVVSICDIVKQLSIDSGFQARGKQFLPLPKMVLQEVMSLILELKGCKNAYPDKQTLYSVQEFFQYTERESRHLFEELDRDKDGQVTLEDLKAIMCKWKLPSTYARNFLQRTQNNLFTKSFGWDEFLSLVQEKEPIVIGLYNSLGISKSGTLQRNHVKSLLLNAGIPAEEEYAVGMMNFLAAGAGGCIKYDQFRRFMVLLPTEQLATDPWAIWLEASIASAAPSGISKTFTSESSSSIQSSIKDMASIQSIQSAGTFSNFISKGARSLSSLIYMEHCKHLVSQDSNS